MEVKNKEYQIHSIPWEFEGAPQREKIAYLCYFTSESCEEYRDFDNKLTIFGKDHNEVDVFMIDKERISPEVWNALLKGFRIKEVPALVVSESPLNIENALEEGATEYKPPSGEITVYTPEDTRKHISDADEFLNNLLENFRSRKSSRKF